MWRSSRRLIVECFNYVMRCGRVNFEIEDIPDYDIQDVPVYFQPETFDIPIPTRQQDDLQHRPDAPCMRRRSPPEVLSKMLKAIDEMNETRTDVNSIPEPKSRTVVTSIPEPEVPFEPRIHTAKSPDDFGDHS